MSEQPDRDADAALAETLSFLLVAALKICAERKDAAASDHILDALRCIQGADADAAGWPDAAPARAP